jgi:hypothetical protein
MWQSWIFWLAGWGIVISSGALLCLPWQWHHRFGQRVLPIVVRHVRLYGLAAGAFGVILLFGVFAGSGAPR